MDVADTFEKAETALAKINNGWSSGIHHNDSKLTDFI